MARKNPVPEKERQICRRMLFIRQDRKRISRQAAADIMGIHVRRLQAYEIGRVPLTTEVALKFCAEFDVNQQWLAEEKGLLFTVHEITPEIKAKASQCRLFSDAYEKYLRNAIKPMPSVYENLVAENSVGLAHSKLTATVGGNTYGYGAFLPDEIIATIGNVLKATLKNLSLEERIEFRNVMLEVAKAFAQEKQNLTKRLTSKIIPDVKSLWPDLKKRLQAATSVTGKKSELAEFLDVDLPVISRWLAVKSKREPGAEYTLQMLHWVEENERNK